MKACGFLRNLPTFFFEKIEEQKALKRFLKFIIFALFFIQKKSAAKEVKKRAVLSLCQC